MHSVDHQPKVRGLSPPLVGLVIGFSAAIPIYLWQSSIEIGAATFIILGYTAWLWTHAHNHSLMRGALAAELRTLDVNATSQRVRRLLLDPGFWWNVIFGGTIVTGSVWYAGLKDGTSMFGVAGAWLLIAICLRYGLTLHRPGTLCARCGYDLTVHLNAEGSRIVVCPECGSKWSAAQIGGEGQSTQIIDWRRRAA